MRAGLLIIPNLTGDINQTTYIADCMKVVQKEGFIPLCPNIYKPYTEQTQLQYAHRVKHAVEATFLFVDFGEDQEMTAIAELFDNEQVRRRTTGEKAAAYKNTLFGILQEVSSRTNIPIVDLKRNTRKREIVDARFVYFLRAKQYTNCSLSKIGALVSKDHASVLHGIKEAQNTAQVQEVYKLCFSDDDA